MKRYLGLFAVLAALFILPAWAASAIDSATTADNQATLTVADDAGLTHCGECDKKKECDKDTKDCDKKKCPKDCDKDCCKDKKGCDKDKQCDKEKDK
ncbi:MAG: hypothetical protein D6741_05190 [Planctomycetota bacterium]|nr:MAG: hypothetical protein D6741_05190 [Planctomycetota bacterium]